MDSTSLLLGQNIVGTSLDRAYGVSISLARTATVGTSLAMTYGISTSLAMTWSQHLLQ